MGTYAVLEDADLVARARAGDRNAFAVLYDRYFEGIHDFLTRMTRNRTGAADLVQETFLEAMRQLHALQQPANARSWLFRIAYVQAMEHLEKQERWPLPSRPAGGNDTSNATFAVTSSDENGDKGPAAAAGVASLAWEAARALDDRAFAVLDLHVRQGLSSAEIAEVLQVRQNHAYVLVKRLTERVGATIGMWMLVRTGTRACDVLSATVAGNDVLPLGDRLRKRLDRHVDDCRTCQRSQRDLPAPIATYASLVRVPAAAGVKDDIWRALDRAWPSGRQPSVLERWRHVVAVLGAVALVAVLPVVLVLGLAGGGTAAPVVFDPLTASPVDRSPEPAQTFGVGPALSLPEPPPYEPPVVPTATPSASETPTAPPTPGIPPVVTISEPSAGSRSATRQDSTGPYAVVRLNGTADDADSPPELLTFEWSSNLEGLLSTNATSPGVKLHVFDFEDQCQLLNLGGSASSTHEVSLTVTDETGAQGVQRVRVTVEASCLGDLPSDPPDDPSPSPSPSPTETQPGEPAYATSCAPTSHTVSATGSDTRTSQCTARADEGFSGPIAWGCQVNGPSGGDEITCTVDPASGGLSDGGTHSVNVDIVSNAPPAGTTWEIVIWSEVNGTTRFTTVTVTVQ